MKKKDEQTEIVPDAGGDEPVGDGSVTLTLTDDERDYLTGVLEDRQEACRRVADRDDTKKSTAHAKLYEVAMCERLLSKLGADA